MGIDNKTWLFPSIQHQLAEIVRETSEGFSCCLVLFPPLDESDFADDMLTRMMREDIRYHRIHVSDLTEISVQALVSNVLIASKNHSSLQEFLEDTETPDLTVFQGFDSSDTHKQKKILAILNEWSNLQHAGARKSFCLLAGGESLPVLQSLYQETKLKTRLLIGMPSVAEMQVYLRLTSGWTNELDTKWYEMLLPSLAGNDFDLLQHLLLRTLNDFNDVMRALDEFARCTSWEKAALEDEFLDWKPNSSIQTLSFRSIQNSQLLARQICIFQPEHGEEVHPAVLAVLKREDEIRHRVWRSQAALVLPVIDQIRSVLFKKIKIKIQNESDKDIPEIGALKHAIGQLGRENITRQTYYEPVQQVADVRNKLAHLETISKSEYESVFRFWQKLQRT